MSVIWKNKNRPDKNVSIFSFAFVKIQNLFSKLPVDGFEYILC